MKEEWIEDPYFCVLVIILDLSWLVSLRVSSVGSLQRGQIPLASTISGRNLSSLAGQILIAASLNLAALRCQAVVNAEPLSHETCTSHTIVVVLFMWMAKSGLERVPSGWRTWGSTSVVHFAFLVCSAIFVSLL